MSIYDKLGNMQNERASKVAGDIAQQVEKLLKTLFLTEGMTIIEARALLGYIKNMMDVPAITCILRQQMVKD